MASSREAFVNMLWPAALQASQQTGVDPRIIVAQAAQETGWGRSAPGNNYFGIKSHGKGGGQNFTTHEVINGKRVKIRDNFRQYESPDESVLGYAEFIQKNPRYRPFMQAQGLDAQLQALGQSGYATDPNYAQSVGSIARSLPAPTQLSPEAQAFVNNNPQPGGYGPGIDDPNAPKPPAFSSPDDILTASTGQPFGSISPMMGPQPVPTDVARFASSPDPKPFADRLSAAGKALDADSPAPPRLGPMGDARSTGNALMSFMNQPTAAQMLIQKRLAGIA